MTEETAEQKLARYEYVLEAQADEIDKLRAEVARLQSVGGAHSVLKSIYLNGELPESLRAKAAIGCIQHETPRLQPERAPLELKAEKPEMSLAELCEVRLQRQLTHEGQEIRVEPNGEVVVLKPAPLRAEGEQSLPKPNGNGSDGD